MKETHNSVITPVNDTVAATASAMDGVWRAPEKRNTATMYLNQVSELDKQIRLKKSKLEIMRDALSMRSPVLSDMPRASSPSLHSMEDKLSEILAIEDEIKALEGKKVILKAEMMGVIGKIEKTSLQMVLIQCFLNLRSNTEASRDLHYSRRWIARLKSQAIGALEKVLDQKE